MFVILIKSLIIGAVGGAAIAAGAARMFYAPELQAMGAFRTLGELNACKGDPASHISFGLGFVATAAIGNAAAGAMGQDVFHRIVPNWAAGILLTRNSNVEETLYNPMAMAIAGGIVGALVVVFMNTAAALVPESMALIGNKVLTPAGQLLVSTVMPGIFWLAAVEGGKQSGIAATVIGGFAHMIIGNAVPGLVLGILLGKTIEEQGWSRTAITMLSVITLLFILIGYFRNFHLQILGLF